MIEDMNKKYYLKPEVDLVIIKTDEVLQGEWIVESDCNEMSNSSRFEEEEEFTEGQTNRSIWDD